MDNPSPGAHRVGLRAAVSVGVPLLLCLAVDRPEWTLYAAFGASGAVVRRQRSPWVRAEPLRSLHAVRLALAVVVVGTIAELTSLGHPYWAMVAVLATLAGSDHHTRWARGWLRAGGTLLGLLPAAALLALDLGPVAVVLTVIVLQFITEVLVGRNYGLALLFITPMALLIGQVAVQRPMGELLLDRGVETLIGVAVGLVIVTIESRRQHRRA